MEDCCTGPIVNVFGLLMVQSKTFFYFHSKFFFISIANTLEISQYYRKQMIQRQTITLHTADIGWGVLELHSLIYSLGIFLLLRKYALGSLNLFHIWQVSPQPSCSDTCLIWTWSVKGKQFIDNSKIRIKLTITDNWFSDPHIWWIDPIIAINSLHAELFWWNFFFIFYYFWL